MIAHCPRTVAHFLPRLSRPRSTDRPRGRRRTELVPAQLTATIRSDGAHTVWPYSCGPTAVSLQLPQRKEEGRGPGNNALDRQPRGRDGPQPSAQATTISLISEPRSLDLRSSEMWKTRTMSFQSQLVQKEFTVDFWHGPKDREFKRGD